MTGVRCPACGKNVHVTSRDTFRPHAVPIQARTGNGYERCEGSGRHPADPALAKPLAWGA